MTAITANIPTGTISIPYTEDRFAVACGDGFKEVLRDAGVDADANLDILEYLVLYNFGWAANKVVIKYSLNNDPETLLEADFLKDEVLNGRTAFFRAMNRGLNNMLRAKIGTSAFNIQYFIIQRDGEYPRGWNANNTLLLRSAAVNKSY